MKNEIITIKRLGINGEGVGHLRRKICFVKGALPLEKVEVKVTKEEKRFLNAEVVKIIEPSSQRQKSICTQFPECGGCALLHMNYQDQLRFKLDLLKETMAKYAPYDLQQTRFYPVRETDTFEHYRQEVNLPITYYNGKLKVGVYQRQSKLLTLMDNCQMQDPLINETITRIEEILNKHHCHDYDDRLKKGLRFLMIRQIDQEQQVVFVTGTDGISPQVTHEIIKIPAIKGLFYTINTTRRQDFTLQGYKRIYGTPYLSYDIDDHTYTFSVKTDMINHPSALKEEIALLKERIDENDNVLSINCSNAIVESELANQVVAIDESKENIDSARLNAQKNEMDHIQFIKGNLSDAVSQIRHHDYDTLLIRLDRDRIDERLVESIYKGHVKKVILISDNVSSLSKSLNDEQGYFIKNYDLVSAEGIDNAPQTARATYYLTLVRK